MQREGLHTVCQEAGCPNIYECWEDREATFLIGGDQCTRRCDFCQIDTGKPAEFDADEPRRVAESVATMGLRYATVTGVARDDLPDGGAWLYAETVRQIHKLQPGCGVELLIPDFNAEPDQLAEVFGAAPEVLAHNVETVPRIFKRIRPGFRYERSLDVITQARAAGLVTKSNLILGHGRGARRGLPGAARPARGRLRADHDHAVPAAHPAPPPGGALGQAGGVRRAARGGRADRLRRRDERAAGALVATAPAASTSRPSRPAPNGTGARLAQSPAVMPGRYGADQLDGARECSPRPADHYRPPPGSGVHPVTTVSGGVTVGSRLTARRGASPPPKPPKVEQPQPVRDRGRLDPVATASLAMIRDTCTLAVFGEM